MELEIGRASQALIIFSFLLSESLDKACIPENIITRVKLGMIGFSLCWFGFLSTASDGYLQVRLTKVRSIFHLIQSIIDWDGHGGMAISVNLDKYCVEFSSNSSSILCWVAMSVSRDLISVRIYQPLSGITNVTLHFMAYSLFMVSLYL